MKHKASLPLPLLTVLFATACSEQVPESRPLDGYNPEDKVRITHVGDHLRVGRLMSLGDKVCTATLVAPDVIATADHCTEDENKRTRDPEEYKFYMGYDNGAYKAVSDVTAISAPETSVNGAILPGEDNEVSYSANDVAFMKLEKKLGDIYGHDIIASEKLDTLPNGEYYQGQQLGYGVRYGPYLTGDLKVRFNHHFMQEKVLIMQCEIAPGDSGGPLFVYPEGDDNHGQQRYLYGIISEITPGGKFATSIVGQDIPDFDQKQDRQVYSF